MMIDTKHYLNKFCLVCGHEVKRKLVSIRTLGNEFCLENMESKKTVVVGASNDRSRYSYQAVKRLMDYDHEVVPVSNKKGEVNGLPIRNDFPTIEDVDTVTLYVGPKNQDYYIDYILGLKPKRIIFNPGTANPSFEDKAREEGINVVTACTLVMLSVGNY